MGNKLETAPEETIGEGKCCHYWIIEMPQGPTCRGVCHFCGGEKETDSFGPDWQSRCVPSTPKSSDLPSLTDLTPTGEQDNS